MDARPHERLALGAIVLVFAATAVTYVAPPADRGVNWNGDEDETTGQELRSQVAGAVVDREEAGRPLGDGERMDVNTSSALQLERLPRVGPKLAAAIAEHRAANGPFRTLEDLDAVPGIGPAMLASLEPHVALPVASGASPRPQAQGAVASTPPAALPAAPVELNSATEAELQTLPGIGPALARRIVEWRLENGRFAAPAELQQVRGIGPKMMERLTPLVRVNP